MAICDVCNDEKWVSGETLSGERGGPGLMRCPFCESAPATPADSLCQSVQTLIQRLEKWLDYYGAANPINAQLTREEIAQAQAALAAFQRQ